MSADLKRRYARALRLYPAAYRRERGPELLATLLDAAPEGQRRPSAREFTALVLGALRAHAGTERRSLRDSWLTAFRTAALLALTVAVAGPLVSVAVQVIGGLPASWVMLEPTASDLAGVPFGLLAIVAVLRGHPRVGVLVALLAAGAVAMVAWLAVPSPAVGLTLYPIAAALLLPLFRATPRPAAGLVRFVPLIAVVLEVVDQVAGNFYSDFTGVLEFAFGVAAVVGALMWVAVDERVPLAVGLFCLSTVALRVVGMTVFAIQDDAWPDPAITAYTLLITGAAPALLLTASALALRRRVRV